MGQALSRLWKGHFARPAGLLSNSPVDVFLLISDQLSADALAALSLTCRSFYIILKARIQLHGADREALLLLLEKDLGDKLYYCPFCSRLHPFSPSWTPIGRDLRARKIQSCCYKCCPVRGQAFRLSNLYHYCLGYHLARLVMNRHLFGAPSGLPLDNLQRCFVEFKVNDARPWTQDWSAKIVDNELFLQAIHVFYEPDSAGFGAAIGHQNHYICPHIITAIPPGRNLYMLDEISELKVHRLHRLIPCRGVLRHCSRCLTDFQITIERVKGCKRPLGTVPTTPQRGWVSDGFQVPHCYEIEPHKTPHAAGWQITIVAYHQFGSCRSPQDWKWKALTPGAQLLTSRRNPVLYPPGAVIRKWQQSI
ncbi:hypothetical protein HD806DRAFT_36323 [Xylariaceae sp. AK1471]|nr:hypothetical protein HD806DRAFT_36323 [Xylariaceae sp. AK1471]